MPPPNQPMERAKAVRARHESELLARRGVVSVGVGLRQREGRLTDEVAVVVMVRRKLPLADLPPNEALPAELEGVGVDVQEAGDVVAHSA